MTGWLTSTPKEILDRHGVDVFDVTIGQLDGDVDVLNDLIAQAWCIYANRMIGDYDYTVWLYELDNLVCRNWRWYKRMHDRIISDEMLGLESGKIEETLTEIVESSELIDTVTSDNRRTEDEDLPDIPIDVNDKYLSRRSGVVGDSSGESTTSSTSDTASQRELSTFDGLTAETTLRVLRLLQNATEIFVQELDPLFVNRW